MIEIIVVVGIAVVEIDECVQTREIFRSLSELWELDASHSTFV
jgi:hypothetical protein